MIEYIHQDQTGKVQVKLDDRVIGEIRKEDGGWRYFPKGKKDGGDLFPSLAKCKLSLSEP